MTFLDDPRWRRLTATILVCGTALAVDRFVIGPPSTAEAADPATTGAAGAAGTTGDAGAAVVLGDPPAAGAAGSSFSSSSGQANVDAAAGDPPADVRRVLADRLDRLDRLAVTESGEPKAGTDGALAAAFGDPEEWCRTETPDVAPDEDPDGLRARFASTARLTAVVHAADGLGGAQINGRFVPLGGVIGGFRVIAIGSRSAVLTGPGGRLVLEMAAPRIEGRDPPVMGSGALGLVDPAGA